MPLEGARRTLERGNAQHQNAAMVAQTWGLQFSWTQGLGLGMHTELNQGFQPNWGANLWRTWKTASTSEMRKNGCQKWRLAHLGGVCKAWILLPDDSPTHALMQSRLLEHKTQIRIGHSAALPTEHEALDQNQLKEDR